MILKTTNHIFNNPWDTVIQNESLSYLPPSSSWEGSDYPSVYDIKLWEQLYLRSGNIGVYAAYDPYLEMYMITYNRFMKEEFGFKTFTGENAQENLCKKLKDYGIELPTWNYWVNK